MPMLIPSDTPIVLNRSPMSDSCVEVNGAISSVATRSAISIDRAHLWEALLDFVRKIKQMHVAWVALPPYRRNPDLGLVHVIRGHSSGVQHRLRRALRFRLRNTRAHLKCTKCANLKVSLAEANTARLHLPRLSTPKSR